MKKVILIGLALIVVAGVAGPFLPLNFLRPGMERALERGLGRRVEIGQVHVTLFSTPGFTLDDVTIHEDPRAGIEPFAYVQSLEAHPRLLPLLLRRLEFSSLNLGDASINLVKTDPGPWNFQFLLGSTSANLGTMPAIKMRTGRVNFKFGDTKSIFYFNDADLEADPADDGSVEVRFSGVPSRTDRSAQDFGHFFVRGKATPSGGEQRLDMNVELEPSALEEITRLLDQRAAGVRGMVGLEAQLSGLVSQLQVTGQLQIQDLQLGDLPPQRGAAWKIDYKGTLDLHGERLELSSVPGSPQAPAGLRLRAWDFLSTPRWDASADLTQVALASVVDLVRQMGAPLPATLAPVGTVSGAVQYSRDSGLNGRVEIIDASLQLPEAQTLRADTVPVVLEQGTMSLEPFTVHIGDTENAEVQAIYVLGVPGGVDLKISTKGLSVADLPALGLAAMPLVERTSKGTWRGWARYQGIGSGTGGKPGIKPGIWSGEYELRNATVALDGLADPLSIASSTVSLKDGRLNVTRIKAAIGKIPFAGEYRWDAEATRQHHFRITVQEADAAELGRLLDPVVSRGRGFFARALRLSETPLPSWLEDQRGDGTVQVESLTAGDTTVRGASARLLWDGAVVRLVDLGGRVDQSTIAGDLEANFIGSSPRYRFEGKVQDVPYKGGKLDFNGSVEASGAGADFLKSLRGEGRLNGRSIGFAPDADFRSVAGCFELVATAGGPRWNLYELEIMQGQDSYSGRGTAQADGKVSLDLSSRGRQVRYTGSLFALVPQP